jgi:hypothetical protein
MDQKIIGAIAADVAELGRQLTRQDITDMESQALIIAGAMPAIAAYEIGEGLYSGAGRGELTLASPGDRTLEDAKADREPPPVWQRTWPWA